MNVMSNIDSLTAPLTAYGTLGAAWGVFIGHMIHRLREA